MIVFRYLSREVLLAFSAVSAVLLVIIMSGRFIKYLAQAAQGMLDPGVLLLIMGYRIPGFLQLILPLGLFLGILLAYGRLYLESEMTVLTATGMSEQRLLSYTLVPAFFIALVCAWLSFVLTPQGVQNVAQILNEQDALTEFDTLVPGRFQAMRDGSRVTYAQELSGGRDELRSVFISEKRDVRKPSDKEEGITVLVAQSGRQEIQEDGSRYLVLHDGYRYDGTPGDADYRVIHYDTYGVLLPKPEIEVKMGERETMRTAELLGSDQPRMQSELQWRLSIPLLVLIVTLIAVPLSRVNPRQGRFLKLLPAILLYMAYLALLVAARSALDKGRIPVAVGLWPVHGVFLLIGLLLVYWQPMRLKLAQRRAQKESQNA
ncbi:LPS export ABC transporter permease LptF [Denitrificimonas caeni]|uniref:Lipopolysaccharide export system permease protein LptF n=1 Tax=Denitrificimonas caeni TaxID=521720 RepID=A0AAE9VSF6_9GAMM|nr:LPS export ABC transporter permease LptF [Denitrificimonas caeni]NLJ12654.1 LPS export ABC transporter permease LptF [Gammaproteobacteria bacterium]WBE24121.1 LPS export ABC transporter permease LptF [Denitrificimonas caeni]